MARVKGLRVAAPVMPVAPKRTDRYCGDRRLPRNPAYEHTKIIPTAPQEFRFCKGGAKHWA